MIFSLIRLTDLFLVDDRPVRESERDAAVSHFSAAKSEQSKPPFELETGKSSTRKARIVPSG